MRTLSARPWPTTVAVTVAPLSGVAELDAVAVAEHQDVVELDLAAGFDVEQSRRGAFRPVITRYCLPPVTTTAYMTSIPL